MSEGIWLGGGTGFDEKQVSAKPEDVRYLKSFLGNGSDKKQIGELMDVPPVQYVLSLNGKQKIPKGIHDGTEKIKSEIPFLDDITVYPTGDTQIIETKNKYINNSIYVNQLDGLIPENIKKDIIILGVRGIYEGYD